MPTRQPPKRSARLPWRSAKAIKRGILSTLRNSGIEINNKIADIAPAWAERILSESSCLSDRYRVIDAYLSALQERVSRLRKEEKHFLPSYLAPLSKNSVLGQLGITSAEHRYYRTADRLAQAAQAEPEKWIESTATPHQSSSTAKTMLPPSKIAARVLAEPRRPAHRVDKGLRRHSLTFEIRQGGASPQDIQKFLDCLDDVYRQLGGSGLSFECSWKQRA